MNKERRRIMDEMMDRKVNREDVLFWHCYGNSTKDPKEMIEDLAKVVADLANGYYDAEHLKSDIASYNSYVRAILKEENVSECYWKTEGGEC